MSCFRPWLAEQSKCQQSDLAKAKDPRTVTYHCTMKRKCWCTYIFAFIYDWFSSPKPIVERLDRKNPKCSSVAKRCSTFYAQIIYTFTHHYSIHSGWKILMCSRIFPSFTAIKVAKTVQLATRSCNLRLKKQARNALFILPPSGSGPCSCVCWLLANHSTYWLAVI